MNRRKSIAGNVRREPAVRGLEDVVVANTRLSHVGGAQGELVIAGFPVDALAPHAQFEEVLFLLWHDRLPTVVELTALRHSLVAQRLLPPATVALLRAAAARAVPAMDALRMGVATLSLTDAAPNDNTRGATLERAIGLVARFPALVAAYARLRRGEEPIAPHLGLGHTANYLYMLTGAEPSLAVVRALETYLNTVVDHGLNASTFTARVIISTRSDIVSAVVGAVGALKGPLHGGAPGPALDMVFAIQARAAGSGRSIAAEAAAVVRETLSAGGRIMGFGHRVYAVRDPRAQVLDAAARSLFADAVAARLYADVRTIEAVVLRILRAHKPGRRLETNVEFYTALLLHGVGLEAELFTPTFAVGRIGGWTAHILEQIAEDRLIRPQSTYVGPIDRRWIPIGARRASAEPIGVDPAPAARIETIGI